MSRQQKREEREQLIIGKAIALFTEKGFLGVRMSDIAKASGLAMGTIYSHFAAKEDVLMGCATLLTNEEKAIFHSITASDASAVQRIVTGFTVNWLIAQHHPQFVEIQNLSLMPSVWSRANPQRIQQLNTLHGEFFDMAQTVVMEMLNNDLNMPADMDDAAREELGMLLNHGMWGLCVGLNSTAQSGIARADGDHHEACSCQHFTTNVIHFLKGYGWQEAAPQLVFAACREKAQACLQGHAWFACPVAGDAESVA
ncbi:MAG: TetR/AcrR family transcriptional regulator [Mariprofundaceae bacterium]|nr:TetR/AcrR family transcriptional regulator [Mariprofundaceae bacterium]